MGKTYFTADLHLGHRLVSGLRGFPDPAEHDAVIAERWRARVRADDVVWVLGDLAVTSSRRGIDDVLGKVADLPGTKQLIAGNHDPVHPMHRQAHEWQRRYLEVFESVQAFARRQVGLTVPADVASSQTVLLSHFPYSGDHSAGSRYLVPPAGRGPLAAARAHTLDGAGDECARDRCWPGCLGPSTGRAR